MATPVLVQGDSPESFQANATAALASGSPIGWPFIHNRAFYHVFSATAAAEGSQYQLLSANDAAHLQTAVVAASPLVPFGPVLCRGGALYQVVASASLVQSGEGGSSTVTSADISDASAVGKSLLTAKDAPTALAAIGGGTSNLELGTTATTALAGNYTPPAATTAAAGVVKMGAAVSDSVATDVATLMADYNKLLASLRAAGSLSK